MSATERISAVEIAFAVTVIVLVALGVSAGLSIFFGESVLTEVGPAVCVLRRAQQPAERSSNWRFERFYVVLLGRNTGRPLPFGDRIHLGFPVG